MMNINIKQLNVWILFLFFANTVWASSINSPGQLSCLLEPSEQIQLSSSATGVVTRVHTERGEVVKKNQVLLSLNDAVERASLATYQAKMAFAQRKLTRNESMFEEQMLSELALDELRTEFELAKLYSQEAKERLNLRRIKSPIDGIVVQRHVSPGEYIGDQPALEIAAIDPLHAEIVMHADNYGSISEGMSLDIEVVNKQKQVLAGVVKIVDRVIDGASGTFGVRVEIANPKNAVPAGLKCHVRFNNQVAAQAP